MDGTAESREGTQFGPYRLRRLVGRGGMGDVYEAEDTVRERIVALKLMSETLSSDPVFRTRMQREARTAGRLQELHVVPIHDFGEIDGQLYVDMRLINGVDLAAMLRRQGPLAPPRAVAIVRQIGSALDAAHAAGATHRDVKPENILVSADDFAYLVDFGIASATTDEKLTQLGNTVGTLYYMAPERFSESHATYRADIYALTCVLYECLTGSPPYQGDQLSVMGAHINQAIPRPSTVRPGIPVAFDAVIARGMAKNPEDRYVTCGDLSAAAHAALATADQDRATDILRRSRVAKLPVPSTHPVSPGTRWPQPTPWAGGRRHGATVVSAAPVSPPALVVGWCCRRRRGGAGGRPGYRACPSVAVIWTRTSAPPPPPPADAVELRVLNDGVFVGSSVAPTTIDIFNEPICPPCGSFIRSYASDIDTAVADKQLAVRYHLLNFLDDQSHSKNYSTRAVAASYCVAGQNDPKLYASFYSALFGSDFQPQENAASDRTDAELAHLAQTVGAEPTAISCIKSGADLGTAQTKATNASETLAGFNASGTPFVWDGSMVVNYQDPSWLARLIG